MLSTETGVILLKFTIAQQPACYSLYVQYLTLFTKLDLSQ